MRQTIALTFLLCLPATTPALADAVRLAAPEPGALLSAGFRVEAAGEVEIVAVGLRRKFTGNDAVRAWLMRQGVDEPVWAQDPETGEPVGASRLLRRSTTRVPLAPGDYVLHLAAGRRARDGKAFHQWRTVLNDVADLLNREDPQASPAEYFGKCEVTVTPLDGLVLQPAPVAVSVWPVEVRPADGGHLVTIPFRLTRTARLKVHVTGEVAEAESVALDYGWIEDARTGRTVWSAEDESPQPAGNAAVNVHWVGELALNAGDYLAGFLSDAVHGPGDWHDLPPYDPEAWGLRLAPLAADAGALVPTSADLVVARAPELLVRLVRPGNDAALREEFTLSRTSRLHVLCLGEGGSEVFDRGAITDLGSNQEVWALTGKTARPAGGAGKNLRFDGEITLPAGRYRATYATDGSHTCGDWNATPPTGAQNYGLTVRLLP
ncbi:MAG: hypothetical protein Q7W56_01705 [Candidatus Latescibacteria bacterium]|nr:hypothetical protein [Candidatus Latescibacterota bacterium]